MSNKPNENTPLLESIKESLIDAESVEVEEGVVDLVKGEKSKYKSSKDSRQ